VRGRAGGEGVRFHRACTSDDRGSANLTRLGGPDVRSFPMLSLRERQREGGSTGTLGRLHSGPSFAPQIGSAAETSQSRASMSGGGEGGSVPVSSTGRVMSVFCCSAGIGFVTT
jgi:hypothetical protein